MNKFEWKSIILILGLFIFIIAISLIATFDREPDVSDHYYRQYAIRLKGVIIDEKKMDDRHECYKLKVLSSNIKSHDLRGNGGKYFLYINNDAAFLMWAHLDLGDTLDIDYETNHMDVIDVNNNQKEFHGLPHFGSGYRDLVSWAENYME